MINYAIFSNLEKDLKESLLIFSFKVQVPALKNLSLSKFAPNILTGQTIIEFYIVNDDSPSIREESYSYKIKWNGELHKASVIIKDQGGNIINKSDDVVEADNQG